MCNYEMVKNKAELKQYINTKINNLLSKHFGISDNHEMWLYTLTSEKYKNYESEQALYRSTKNRLRKHENLLTNIKMHHGRDMNKDENALCKLIIFNSLFHKKKYLKLTHIVGSILPFHEIVINKSIKEYNMPYDEVKFNKPMNAINDLLNKDYIKVDSGVSPFDITKTTFYNRPWEESIVEHIHKADQVHDAYNKIGEKYKLDKNSFNKSIDEIRYFVLENYQI